MFPIFPSRKLSKVPARKFIVYTSTYEYGSDYRCHTFMPWINFLWWYVYSLIMDTVWYEYRSFVGFSLFYCFLVRVRFRFPQYKQKHSTSTRTGTATVPCRRVVDLSQLRGFLLVRARPRSHFLGTPRSYEYGTVPYLSRAE